MNYNTFVILVDYSGFRYIAVYGYPKTIQSRDVVKYVIHANINQRTVLNTSDATLNNVNQLCINSQKTNLQSVVTGIK